MSELNEQFIKLSSKIPFPKEIPLGEDVDVTIDGFHFITNCVKHETFDLQDGTVNKVYVLKSLSE